MTKKQLAKLLGQQLKDMRKAKGWGQVKLTKKLGVSQPLICKLEKGTAIPDVWLARKIGKTFKAQYFSVPEFDGRLG